MMMTWTVTWTACYLIAWIWISPTEPPVHWFNGVITAKWMDKTCHTNRISLSTPECSLHCRKLGIRQIGWNFFLIVCPPNKAAKNIHIATRKLFTSMQLHSQNLCPLVSKKFCSFATVIPTDQRKEKFMMWYRDIKNFAGRRMKFFSLCFTQSPARPTPHHRWQRTQQ